MELPRDVVLKIASYMDIDTRRRLGIYIKIHIPDEIKSRLVAVIPHPNRVINDFYSRVSLGYGKNDRPVYVIHSNFGLLTPIKGGASAWYLGFTWHHPSFFDPNYKNIMTNCQLIMTCIYHSDQTYIIDGTDNSIILE